jgi:acyl carrier protein
MDIEQRVIQCVVESLNLDLNSVTFDSANKDFDNWDSFGQIAIISNIENVFSIEFTVEDIYLSTSVKILITKVKEYLRIA